MTRTTRFNTGRSATTPSLSSRGTARSLALTVTGVVAATAVSAGLALGPSAAHADPGDTFVAIGSSQLVQSEDLAAIQVPLDTETVTLDRDDDFSSCLGEGNPWTSVLPGSSKPVTGVWSRRRHENQSVSEHIAQAKTPAKAKQLATTLLDVEVRGCQGKHSDFDFHYGPTTSFRVGSGFATWAASYTGQERRPDGGVVVVRKGTNFGLVYVNGTWGPVDQTLESVAKVAVDRLA
jgi:hypothetical protein